MQVLSTRLEHNDQGHDEAETCPLKCPHYIVIRDEKSVDIFEVAGCTEYIADAVFFNCLTVHISTYVRAAGLVHTPGWLVA